MTNTPFRNLVLQGLRPVVLPYAQKQPPPNNWQTSPIMSLEDADINDRLLADGKINIAVGLQKKLIAVDVDIIDADVVDEIYGKIQHTPCRKLGQRGFTCIYKSDGSKYKKFHLSQEAKDALGEPNAAIDVLAGNRYTILPPSIHPDILSPYQWLLEDQEIILANIPVFDRTAFIALLTDLGISVDDWSVDNTPAKSRGGQPGNQNAAGARDSWESTGIVSIYSEGAFQSDSTVKELIQTCLAYIPADCSYDDWYKVGLAINHSITGDEGAKIFYDWSKTAKTNYSDDDIKAKCHDLFHRTEPIKGKQLTFSHLEYRAKQNPAFMLSVTPEQLTAIAILNNTIAANRYDIGDLETEVKRVETYEIPNDLSIYPLHSEQVHAAITRHILDTNIVRTEDMVMCYDNTDKVWMNAKKFGSGVITDAARDAANYIVQHPRFTESFLNANGEVSESKINTAMMSVGSAARQANIVSMMIREAKKLPIRPLSEFDNNNEEILLADGYKVCLRTGKRTEACATDYMLQKVASTIAPAGQYGNAPSILMDVFSENKNPAEMITFFQRLAGYCLSGDVSLQKVFCFLGSSNNGKSFLVRQLMNLMGSHAASISSDVLMASKKGFDVNLDRARTSLSGIRLGVVTDTAPTAVFNEELFKGITESTFTYRKLFEEVKQATNHAKVVICCNDVPALGSWDAAMQRRFICIPFCKTYNSDKSRDNQLLDELKAGMPGLLRWIVDGRIAMLEDNNNLAIPKEVIEGTEEQVFLGDPMSLAIRLACSNTESKNFVPNKDISNCLTQWVHSADDRFPAGLDFEMLTSPMSLGKKLRPIGYKNDVRKIDGKAVRGWYMDLKYPEFKAEQTAVRDILDSLS